MVETNYIRAITFALAACCLRESINKYKAQETIMTKDRLKHKTLLGLGWSGIAQTMRMCLMFAISIILARLLNPSDFGLLAMVMVFSGFAQLFSEMGLGAALIQKLDLDDRHLNSVFWVNIITGLALTAIFILLAPVIASFYNEPGLRILTIVISANFAIGSLKVVQYALLQKEMRFKSLAFIEVTSVFLSGATAVSMAVAGFGVWSLVIQVIILNAVSVIMTWFMHKWKPSFLFNFSALKELIGYSFNLLGFNIFDYWVGKLHDLVIGKYLGSFLLGIYNRAFMLMTFPVIQISRVISRVMFPALSLVQKDKQRAKKIYLRAIRMIALVSFPIMITLFVLAEPYIIVVYGEKWRAVIPVLRIFCITGLGQSIGTTVGWIYISQGRTDIMFRWGGFAGIVRIIGLIIGFKWGIIGIASAYVLTSYVILWYPSWAIPGRMINLRFSEMIRCLAPVLACAIFMGITTWVLGNIFLINCADWVRLILQIPFGILLYFLLVHLFKVPAYRDAIQLIKERKWIES